MPHFQEAMRPVCAANWLQQSRLYSGPHACQSIPNGALPPAILEFLPIVGFSYFDPIDKIKDRNNFDVPLTACITPHKVYDFWIFATFVSHFATSFCIGLLADNMGA